MNIVGLLVDIFYLADALKASSVSIIHNCVWANLFLNWGALVDDSSTTCTVCLFIMMPAYENLHCCVSAFAIEIDYQIHICLNSILYKRIVQKVTVE